MIRFTYCRHLLRSQRPSASFGGRNSCEEDTYTAKRCLRYATAAFGAPEKLLGLLSDLRGTCRSCSRCNILIDQVKGVGGGKQTRTWGSLRASIPTLSYPTAGSRAPSAIFYSNEVVFRGANWAAVSVCRLRAAGSRCPKCGMGRGGERCCQITTGAGISTKLKPKSPCLDAQFFLSAAQMKSPDYYEGKTKHAHLLI